MAFYPKNCLDSNDSFPKLSMQTVDQGPVRLPDFMAGGYGVLLIYRGHW